MGEEQDGMRQNRDAEGNVETGGVGLDRGVQRGAEAEGNDKESRRQS